MGACFMIGGGIPESNIILETKYEGKTPSTDSSKIEIDLQE